jgi:predicted GNAT family acetyltransferase
MTYEEIKLANNSTENRFELQTDAHTPFIEYKLSGQTLILIHTEVPPALEGKGVGKAIVEKALQYAKDNGYKIVPLCPFVNTYIKRHKEWSDIVASDAERYMS